MHQNGTYWLPVRGAESCAFLPLKTGLTGKHPQLLGNTPALPVEQGQCWGVQGAELGVHCRGDTLSHPAVGATEARQSPGMRGPAPGGGFIGAGGCPSSSWGSNPALLPVSQSQTSPSALLGGFVVLSHECGCATLLLPLFPGAARAAGWGGRFSHPIHQGFREKRLLEKSRFITPECESRFSWCCRRSCLLLSLWEHRRKLDCNKSCAGLGSRWNSSLTGDRLDV